MTKLILKVLLVAAFALGAFAWALPRLGESRPVDEAMVAVKSGDFVKAMEIFTSLADAGDPVARDALGLMYAYGWGVRRDREHAARLLSRPGIPDLAERYFSVAKELELGVVVARDGAEAREWLKLAADAGHVQARALLAVPGNPHIRM
jgi:TPR repeat protein